MQVSIKVVTHKYTWIYTTVNQTMQHCSILWRMTHISLQPVVKYDLPPLGIWAIFRTATNVKQTVFLQRYECGELANMADIPVVSISSINSESGHKDCKLILDVLMRHKRTLSSTTCFMSALCIALAHAKCTAMFVDVIIAPRLLLLPLYYCFHVIIAHTLLLLPCYYCFHVTSTPTLLLLPCYYFFHVTTASMSLLLPLYYCFHVTITPTVLLRPCYYCFHVTTASMSLLLPLYYCFHVTIAPTVLLRPCYYCFHVTTASMSLLLPRYYYVHVITASMLLFLSCY